MFKYFGQQCQDEEINKAFKNLHHQLINEIVQFCRDWKVSFDEIILTADPLEESIKKGGWVPGTDSCLTCYNFTEDYRKAFVEFDEEFRSSISDEELNKIDYSLKPFLLSL